MELQQVRYFVALTKTLNFTKAAEQCNISQPALSKAVRKLELELGGALIFRERNLTQLTDLGRHMLPSLEQTLAAAQDVGVRASEYQHGSAEPLKLALAPTISANILAEPLRRLAEHFPEATIECLSIAQSSIDHALLHGTVNAAFSIADEKERHDRILRLDLFQEPLDVLSASSADHGDVVRADSLSDLVWVEMLEDDLTQKVWNAYGLQDRVRKVRVRSEDPFHLQSLVAGGLGSMVIPRHAPAVMNTLKRQIEGNAATRHLELRLVAGRRHSAMLGAFVKLVRVFNWQALCQPSSEHGQTQPLHGVENRVDSEPDTKNPAAASLRKPLSVARASP